MDNSQAQSFACQKKFFDDRNYPHGFQRSGDFTRIQAQLLESKGVAMKALHQGSRQPQTAAEEHFVAVCQGKESATTDIEKTWPLYLGSVPRKTIYFAASSAAVEGAGPAGIDSDD